jgi:HD-like signal output (HDOD) protein
VCLPITDSGLAARILSCSTLPSLPAVALDALRLCQGDEVDLAAIAEAVSRDPAIAARLLRRANSATFATRGRVATLTRAVALIGTNATLSVVLSFALVGGRRHGDAGGFDHGAFWRRALFSALAGQALALGRGSDAEEAFLVSLLQDIGMLALREVYPDDYGHLSRLAKGDHAALTRLERDRLGVDHAQVSHLMARRWNLPERIQLAVLASHDTPERGAALDDLIEVAFLSGRLADVWVSPAPGDAIRRALDEAMEGVGLTEEHAVAALQEMAVAVPEAASDFDLDLGAPERIERVMEEARTVLRNRLGPRAGQAADPDRFLKGTALSAALSGEIGAGACPMGLLLVERETAAWPLDLHEILAQCVRQTDLVGEMDSVLVALLSDVNESGARLVSERILARSAAAGGRVSVGVALRPAGEKGAEPGRLLEVARAALGQARTEGHRAVIGRDLSPGAAS